MAKFIKKLKEYPRQFWLILFGRFLAISGVTMVWPFLLLYASKNLGLPLTQVATLMTINAVTGIVASILAGPLIDRVGRKWIMVIALLFHASMYGLMAQANSYLAFSGLMALSGIANPLYRIGADAMVADIIEPEKRAEAYALVRWSNNLGVAIGPVIGGNLVVISYALTFQFAAGGMLLYAILLIFFARETLHFVKENTKNHMLSDDNGNDKSVFRDKIYLNIVALIGIGWIPAALMWNILPVYSSLQFNIPENQYGLIPSTNALMVVFFQLPLTKITKRFNSLHMMAMGMVFYGIGTGMVALSNTFWGFWLSMVIITIGELIFAPTSSTYVANIAPIDMRGRYMSIFNLVQRFAAGTGPVLGGWLSDSIHPRATWVGGLVAGLTSALGLIVLSKRRINNLNIDDTNIS